MGKKYKGTTAIEHSGRREKCDPNRGKEENWNVVKINPKETRE